MPTVADRGSELVVVDASIVVGALLDVSAQGSRSLKLLTGVLAAPHLIDAEVMSVLRRGVITGSVVEPQARIATDLFDELRVQRYPFAPFAHRIWTLRETVTTYDAWYVAIGEALDAPLATRDRRLARASGPTWRFLVPE